MQKMKLCYFILERKIMELIRLQKYLAEMGIASRRKCEEYILEGKVKVNGKVINELGNKVDPKKDEICFEGKKLENRPKLVYLLLNKPIDYVTTVEDPFGRKTVMDLLKGIKQKVVPVGRLDRYTSGALILTNDGEFVYQITHPKHEIEKTYLVTVKGSVKESELEVLRKGVIIENYQTKPAIVKCIKRDPEKHIAKIEIKIHEGKNRQVRKMCEAIDKKVIALHRTKIENIGVKELKLGEWRYLNKQEVESLLGKQK